MNDVSIHVCIPKSRDTFTLVISGENSLSDKNISAILYEVANKLNTIPEVQNETNGTPEGISSDAEKPNTSGAV